MCRADVSEGVRNAFSGSTWRQTLLQTFHQHTALGSSRSSHEGLKRPSTLSNKLLLLAVNVITSIDVVTIFSLYHLMILTLNVAQGRLSSKDCVRCIVCGVNELCL